jgi:hypothetical protein
MIKDLAKLATRLDKLGLTKEADVLDLVLKKISQQGWATEGVAGAEYSGGRQVTPGFEGGRTEKFYTSKPKDIVEFNNSLRELITDISSIKGQDKFPSQVLANLPGPNESRWSRKTTDSFRAYCNAVGKPDAGLNWAEFAKRNSYEPTLSGVYAFWHDTAIDLESDVRLSLSLVAPENSKKEKLKPSLNPVAINRGKGESPQAAGSFGQGVGDSPSANAQALWMTNTFVQKDQNGMKELWYISDADKEMLASMWKRTELPKRNSPEQDREWYRDTIRSMRIRGSYDPSLSNVNPVPPGDVEPTE